jgi:hypothetical protein
MSFVIWCDLCDQDLIEPGGLLFSPPVKDVIGSTTKKFHLCQSCYDKIYEDVLYGNHEDGKHCGQSEALEKNSTKEKGSCPKCDR